MAVKAHNYYYDQERTSKEKNASSSGLDGPRVKVESDGYEVVKATMEKLVKERHDLLVDLVVDFSDLCKKSYNDKNVVYARDKVSKAVSGLTDPKPIITSVISIGIITIVLNNNITIITRQRSEVHAAGLPHEMPASRQRVR